MRFLLDQNLSPDIAGHLAALGHDAIHVRDRGLKEAPDEQVMVVQGCLIARASCDFGLFRAVDVLVGLGGQCC